MGYMYEVSNARPIVFNRPYLESAMFELCMISKFILCRLKENNKSENS